MTPHPPQQDGEQAEATGEEEVEKVEPARKDSSGTRLLFTIVGDVILPIGLYYVLRAAGMGEVSSLLLSGAAPGLNAIYSGVKHRKIDGIGIFTLSILVVGALGTLITGSPRVALARNGVFTGLAAVWLLVTLVTGRPFVFQALKSLLPSKEEKLDELWTTTPSVRRVLRGLTALWGFGLLVDAALRVLMAYALPVDEVPLLDGVLYGVTWITLQIITQITLYRTGTLRMFLPRHSHSART